MITSSVLTLNDPPRVDIHASGLPAGTTHVRVWRTWRGATMRVRADDLAEVIGTEVRIVDWDAPVGEPVDYRIEAWADWILESADIGTIELPGMADCSVAWITDPLAPVLGVQATLYDETDPVRDYGGSDVTALPLGGRLPIGLGSRPTANQLWQFVVEVDTAGESRQIEDLAQAHVLLVRATDRAVSHRTGLIYLQLAVRQEIPRREIMQPGRRVFRWVLAGPEVTPPATRVIMGDRTYADDLAQYATYADSLASQSTYLDRLR